MIFFFFQRLLLCYTFLRKLSVQRKKKEAARFAFLRKSDKSTNLPPLPPHRRTPPGSSGLSGRGRSQFRPIKKSRRGLFPSGRASVPFGFNSDLMLLCACKRKTGVTLFFVRHPCAAAHRVFHSRLFLFITLFIALFITLLFALFIRPFMFL